MERWRGRLQTMDQPVAAAGVIAKSPQGPILMVRRNNGEGCAFPGGVIEDAKPRSKQRGRSSTRKPDGGWAMLPCC